LTKQNYQEKTMATASQSLYNMSVSTDNATSNQGLLMPKLQFRFRVLFLNFGTSGATQEMTKQVIDIARPSVSFPQIAVPVYNSTVYLAGKHEWQTTTVNLRDDAAGSVSKLIGQQLQKQMDFVEQASAATGQDYKFQMNYELLDGGNGELKPNSLETWEMYGCYIESANYNNMGYANNEVATIALTVRFDNAIQSPLTSGVGVRVGRAFGGQSVTGIG
jgi:hypothetical protein